ncbi:MAG: hypothetical protein A2Y81_06540 [Nitrospirae bacterium RBG_13_43_8]|nr:MAG: hypothetical protein A2Y81_06540 [Nitrospirae bacterium RBG_13_43_8]
MLKNKCEMLPCNSIYVNNDQGLCNTFDESKTKLSASAGNRPWRRYIRLIAPTRINATHLNFSGGMIFNWSGEVFKSFSRFLISMRQKYCELLGKVIYAKRCLECGNLKEVGDVETKEARWYCEHLFEKVTFIGPHTNKWRKRFGQDSEHLPVGGMEKYRYVESEIKAYL